MERRSCRAWCWVSRAPATPCEPSKRWRRAASCIPCRRRSPTWAPRSAATALPPFCSLPKRSSKPIPSRPETKSRTRSPATSAAAPATSRFTRRSSWPRPGCAGRKLNPRVNRSMGDRSAHRIIGKALRKVDAVAKVTGATKFADDLAFPRMLYCRLLRSTQPHARIVSIDVTAAKQLDGVQAVLTGPDLPIPFGILPVSQDEHALCIDKVRFIGDPVAAIAATSEDAAFEAMDLIEVEYERLQPIASIEEALDTPEPRIHSYGDSGNIHKRVALEFGDLEAGFAEADLIREDVFFYEGNTHLPLEQHAALAHFDADGKLTLWSSTQTPHYVHRALAKV